MQLISVSNKLDLTIFQGDNVAAFAGRLCSRRNRFGPCWRHKVLISPCLTTTTPVVYEIFQRYMLNMNPGIC